MDNEMANADYDPATSKPQLVVPADFPLQIAGSPQLERLRDLADIQLYADLPQSVELQLERARNAQILINSRGAMTWPGDVLRQLPKLRMITTCSIGIDSIDVAAARELGIVVSNVQRHSAR